MSLNKYSRFRKPISFRPINTALVNHAWQWIYQGPYIVAPYTVGLTLGRAASSSYNSEPTLWTSKLPTSYGAQTSTVTGSEFVNMAAPFGPIRQCEGDGALGGASSDYWTWPTFDSPIDYLDETTWIVLFRKLSTRSTETAPRLVNMSEVGASPQFAGLSLDSINQFRLRIFVRDSNNVTLADESHGADYITNGNWTLAIGYHDGGWGNLSATRAGCINMGTLDLVNGTMNVTNENTVPGAPTGSGNGERFEVGGWVQNSYGFPGDIAYAIVTNGPSPIRGENATAMNNNLESLLKSLAQDPFGFMREDYEVPHWQVINAGAGASPTNYGKVVWTFNS